MLYLLFWTCCTSQCAHSAFYSENIHVYILTEQSLSKKFSQANHKGYTQNLAQYMFNETMITLGKKKKVN